AQRGQGYSGEGSGTHRRNGGEGGAVPDGFQRIADAGAANRNRRAGGVGCDGGHQPRGAEAKQLVALVGDRGAGRVVAIDDRVRDGEPRVGQKRGRGGSTTTVVERVLDIARRVAESEIHRVGGADCRDGEGFDAAGSAQRRADSGQRL